LPFKCDLQRYIEVRTPLLSQKVCDYAMNTVGLCTLNQVDP
jgi:hypothetical protein